MNDFPQLLQSVLRGADLSADDAARAIAAIMDGELSNVRAAALLTALAAKGESADEVIGAARAMRERCVPVRHGLPLVMDVCGTGGDGANTINISTAVAFVVAGCGVPVAKHGNRAASSMSGAADVLESLGVKLDRSAEMSAHLLREHNIAFLFAQRHHPAMRAVGPIRKELGIRTIFNMLGPLTNPAGANRQLVGVSNDRQFESIAYALRGLGADAGAVVHSTNGLDEIAGDAPTYIVQFDREGVRRWTLTPADYGVHASLASMRGGDAATNARALLDILEGERSPRADVVCLNAALALVVAGVAVNVEDGMVRARESIAGGAAIAALDVLRSADVELV
jgi:anthranilate phosphoribosyltransferase